MELTTPVNPSIDTSHKEKTYPKRKRASVKCLNLLDLFSYFDCIILFLVLHFGFGLCSQIRREEMCFFVLPVFGFVEYIVHALSTINDEVTTH